jgi:hypothetical protein
MLRNTPRGAGYHLAVILDCLAHHRIVHHRQHFQHMPLEHGVKERDVIVVEPPRIDVLGEVCLRGAIGRIGPLELGLQFRRHDGRQQTIQTKGTAFRRAEGRALIESRVPKNLITTGRRLDQTSFCVTNHLCLSAEHVCYPFKRAPPILHAQDDACSNPRLLIVISVSCCSYNCQCRGRASSQLPPSWLGLVR